MRAFLSFLLSLLLVSGAGIANSQSLDLRILNSINGPPSASDAAWKDISSSVAVLGVTAPVTVIVTGLVGHDKELTWKGVQMAGALVLTEGTATLLKYTIKRQRPFDAYPSLIYGKAEGNDPSFPSGHTSVAFATATSLSMAFPKWYVIVPSYTYATAVGYSRLHLGVHYPSDVFAGALIGAGSSILAFKLQKLLNKKHQHS